MVPNHLFPEWGLESLLLGPGLTQEGRAKGRPIPGFSFSLIPHRDFHTSFLGISSYPKIGLAYPGWGTNKGPF